MNASVEEAGQRNPVGRRQFLRESAALLGTGAWLAGRSSIADQPMGTAGQEPGWALNPIRPYMSTVPSIDFPGTLGPVNVRLVYLIVYWDLWWEKPGPQPPRNTEYGRLEIVVRKKTDAIRYEVKRTERLTASSAVIKRRTDGSSALEWDVEQRSVWKANRKSGMDQKLVSHIQGEAVDGTIRNTVNGNRVERRAAGPVLTDCELLAGPGRINALTKNGFSLLRLENGFLNSTLCSLAKARPLTVGSLGRQVVFDSRLLTGRGQLPTHFLVPSGRNITYAQTGLIKSLVLAEQTELEG